MRRGSRLLYWVHRWLGIVTCLFCVMWFLSGLVMVYVPFPSWTDQERREALPPVAMERITQTPDDALAAAGVRTYPMLFRLEMLAGEPVYRIVATGKPVTVSAVSGKVVAEIDLDRARRHVASAFPNAQPRHADTIDYDQWTVTRRFDPYRPLYKFALDDAAGTIVYVSSKTGEIVQDATRSERFWNWLGAVPHWIYFSPIRRDGEVWRQAVMWLSGPLIIGAIAGLWVGILRLRVVRRYAGARMSPYRGWMKWHHVGGLVGGLFLTTWIASGWLSVSPFSLFAGSFFSETQRVAYAGWSEGRPYGVTLAAIARAGHEGARDIAFTWIGGEVKLLASGTAGTEMADPQSGMRAPIADTALTDAGKRAFSAATLLASERVREEDLYWYSLHYKRPLPVLRLTFDDANATWLFLDPATGAIAAISDRDGRAYRWLFNFPHTFDLPVLLRNPPLRDAVVWLLSIAGLIVSVSGVVVGFRVLTRRAG